MKKPAQLSGKETQAILRIRNRINEEGPGNTIFIITEVCKEFDVETPRSMVIGSEINRLRKADILAGKRRGVAKAPTYDEIMRGPKITPWVDKKEATRVPTYYQLALLESEKRKYEISWENIIVQIEMMVQFRNGMGLVQASSYVLDTHAIPFGERKEFLKKFRQILQKQRKMENRKRSREERKKEEQEYDEVRSHQFFFELREKCRVSTAIF